MPASKHAEPFTITRRPGWGADLTVTIECNPTDFSWVKLGLAVRVAHNSGARLDGASLVGASLVGARLDGASLVGARLDGARLDGARLDGARLDGARLVGARLDGARLDGARLVGARLVGARLDGASLVGASLVGARLVGARLDGASLVGALIREDKVKRLFATVARLADPYTFYAFELVDGGVKILAGCRWFTLPEFRAHASNYNCYERSIGKDVETGRILDFIETRMGDLGIGVAIEAPAKAKRTRKAA